MNAEHEGVAEDVDSREQDLRSTGTALQRWKNLRAKRVEDIRVHNLVFVEVLIRLQRPS